MKTTTPLTRRAAHVVLALAMLATLNSQFSTLFAQTTTFTYQGRVTENGAAVTGTVDLEFRLFSAAVGGLQVGPVLSRADVVVTGGLFSAALDFGADAFPGADRFLEIRLRPGTSSDPHTQLTPRQAVTPSPYAITAGNLSGSISAGQLTGTLPSASLSGTYSGAVTFNNAANSFTGSGAGVTNVSLRTLNTYGDITWPGSFVLSSSPGVGLDPQSVTAADVNGDGKPDLISASFGNGFGNTLTVLTNSGGGGFVLSSSPVVGSAPTSVTAADVNEDGKVDLISANPGLFGSGNTLTVLTNAGDGNFVLSSSPAVGNAPHSVEAADVNGDGKADLISANAGNNTLTVLTNNGGGGFVISSSPSVGSAPYSVAAADVNGDDKPDLISANYGANTLAVFTNNSIGGFVMAFSLTVGGSPSSVAAADVNGDGQVDLISANRSSDTLTVLTNDGSGGFVLASSPVVGRDPRSATAADVNGDGQMDLISANAGNSTLTVLTNNGSGGFVPASSPAAGSGPYSIAAADVNGDGKVDLISANAASSTLSVLFNAPTFSGGFVGNGSGLTGLNASQIPNLDASKITSGTLADARLSANVALLNANQTFTGTKTFMNPVGIGTATPGSRLEVIGGIRARGGPPGPDGNANNGYTFGAPGDNDTGMSSSANGQLEFYSNSAEVMRIASGGNVGIGTATPTGILTVRTTDNTFPQAVPNFDARHFVVGSPTEGVALSYSSSNGKGYITSLAPSVAWRDLVLQGSALSFQPSGAVETFSILNNGNVGIGTPAPQQQLSVAAGLNVDQNDGNAGTVASTLRFGSGSGEAIGSKRTGGGNQFGLDFYTASFNRMTILNDGRVGINTTSPDSTLTVNGSASKPGGGAWTLFSDERLKKNVRPLSGVLDKLLTLRGVHFEYKDPARINELAGERTGLIAQEVEPVFPDWVETGADGFKRLTIRGFEALTVEALREMRLEKDAQISALEERTTAAEAIRGLYQKMEEKELRIKALESELAELKKLVSANLTNPVN